jgi:hypothetical protein
MKIVWICGVKMLCIKVICNDRNIDYGTGVGIDFEKRELMVWKIQRLSQFVTIAQCE